MKFHFRIYNKNVFLLKQTFHISPKNKINFAHLILSQCNTMKMPLNGLTGIQQSYRGYMYSTISFILHHDDENDYNLPFSDIH